eukprot:TRINITY_DN513_c0_g1_i1.p1 TRINITY_DN513_c0_g1~~TRINITY_DN513_c0_g1_i1.p1  ORF type:complete len:420 (-),score=120.42 TRINITY_DN513_c0_g1_i1:89-1348(-)
MVESNNNNNNGGLYPNVDFEKVNEYVIHDLGENEDVVEVQEFNGNNSNNNVFVEEDLVYNNDNDNNNNNNNFQENVPLYNNSYQQPFQQVEPEINYQTTVKKPMGSGCFSCLESVMICGTKACLISTSVVFCIITAIFLIATISLIATGTLAVSTYGVDYTDLDLAYPTYVPEVISGVVDTYEPYYYRFDIPDSYHNYTGNTNRKLMACLHTPMINTENGNVYYDQGSVGKNVSKSDIAPVLSAYGRLGDLPLFLNSWKYYYDSDYYSSDYFYDPSYWQSGVTLEFDSTVEIPLCSTGGFGAVPVCSDYNNNAWIGVRINNQIYDNYYQIEDDTFQYSLEFKYEECEDCQCSYGFFFGFASFIIFIFVSILTVITVVFLLLTILCWLSLACFCIVDCQIRKKSNKPISINNTYSNYSTV